MMATEHDPAYGAIVQLHRAIVAVEHGDRTEANNATMAAKAWIDNMPPRAIGEGSGLQAADVREFSADWEFRP